MKAMVLAAGLGTRLRPLTHEIPKPMVPMLDRPVMAHIVGLLAGHGFDQVIANLHYFPDTIRDYFGDRLEYRFEEELLGTAGGVRNAADFFGDDPVVIVSGDALTDVDLRALVDRHREAGGIATLTVKKVLDTSEYGVVIHDADGRIQGFQEKPDPAEALSELGNCGIYCFSPEIFDFFPERPFADWAQDVFPALLEADIPFHVYETDSYWNDVGSLDELRQGTFDVLEGRLALEVTGQLVADDVRLGADSSLEGCEQVDGPIWVGAGCRIGAGARLVGPLVIGDGADIGERAALREAIVFPGASVGTDSIAIGAILGHSGIVERMRSFDEL